MSAIATCRRINSGGSILEAIHLKGGRFRVKNHFITRKIDAGFS